MERTLAQIMSQMSGLIDDINTDVFKFNKGQKAAGVRIRKYLQTIKALAQEGRKAITAAHSSSPPPGPGAAEKRSEESENNAESPSGEPEPPFPDPH